MAKSVKRRVEAWPFVLAADKALPPEQQTVFTLAPLTQSESLAVRDRSSRRVVAIDGSMIIERRTSVIALDLAADHIASVENFPIGAPKPWPKDRTERLAYLAQLGDDDVIEVGDEIWAHSTLAGDEGVAVGNSSAPALTSSSGAA